MRLLEDIRVLDLTIAWAGPLAGRFLGDLGADVIHVERPSGRSGAPTVVPRGVTKDAWRWGQLPGPTTRAAIFPDNDPGDRPWNRSGSFNKLNRNKRSLCLDLKHPAGADIFRRLVAISDVVVENNSARAMRGLGFSYPQLSEINQKIIMLSMPGFGSSGPYADWVSLGPILEAASGLAGATGYPDGGPLKLGIAFPDAIGGLHATVAILGALWERDESGQGCFVDLSQHEAYASIGGDLILAASLMGQDLERLGNRSQSYAPQGVYPCEGEDEWVALTIRSDMDWIAFREIVGASALYEPEYETLVGRITHHDEIDGVIGSWTSGRSKWDIAESLASASIPAAPALTNAELVNDPHLNARGFLVDIDQPDVGVRRFPGFPIHFSSTPVDDFRGTAPLGADNRPILRDLLGISEAEIETLECDGVIRTEPRNE